MREIKSEEWMPDPEKGILDYTPEFVSWINSINRGFAQRKQNYKPFILYCQQAEKWLEEDVVMSDSMSIEQQRALTKQEIIRCKQNSYYYANRFLYLKEGDEASGSQKFQAWEAQKIVMFLMDCGYSQLIGKGRQIGFSTVIGGCATKKVAYQKNFFCKFITHTKEKGEEIFDDKVKYAYENLVWWMKPTPGNYRENIMRLFVEEKKGDRSGVGSKMQVVTPKADAINGGSPDLVLIDEIGSIKLFSKMMNEGRPTLFRVDKKTGKLVMRRQVIAWGTGGEMDAAGHVMESEWDAAMAAWDRKDYEYGLIPLFFDTFARDGMNKEFYEAEKIRYYSKTGAEAMGSRTQFHQHYPMSAEDMFLVGSNTVIPIEQINMELQKIIDYEAEHEIEYGYFEPVYDMNHPYTDDKYMPFKLTGARWRKASGPEDPRVRCTVFQHPSNNHVNRYYKGTDPVNAETGHSLMSSAIWDAYENTISAVMNYRSKLVKEDYVQSILMSLHYGMPFELLEINIGEMYADYLDSKRMQNTLVPMKMLPKFMQTATKRYIGIHNNAGTGKHIVNKLIELLDVYSGNIYIRDFYIQLKTFVEKTTPSGKTRYQAQDLKYYFDDVIFSIVYAYLAAECYSHLTPRTKEEDAKRKKRKTSWVRTPDMGLRLAEKDGRGRIVRYKSL